MLQSDVRPSFSSEKYSCRSLQAGVLCSCDNIRLKSSSCWGKSEAIAFHLRLACPVSPRYDFLGSPRADVAIIRPEYMGSGRCRSRQSGNNRWCVAIRPQLIAMIPGLQLGSATMKQLPARDRRILHAYRHVETAYGSEAPETRLALQIVHQLALKHDAKNPLPRQILSCVDEESTENLGMRGRFHTSCSP